MQFRMHFGGGARVSVIHRSGTGRLAVEASGTQATARVPYCLNVQLGKDKTLATIFDTHGTEPEFTLTGRDELFSPEGDDLGVNLSDVGIRQVDIAKVGGGTIGKEYAGSWIYRVAFMDHDRLPEQGIDLVTGMPHDHEYVARMAVEFFRPEDI